MIKDSLAAELELVIDVVVPGGHAAAVIVYEGDLLEVIDLEGEQVCDLIAFASLDRREWLSISHTRATTLRLNLVPGDILQSNWRRPMLEVLTDDVGMHDLITQMCDERRYRLDYNVDGHRSCRTNFTEVLAPWGIEEWVMPDPVNLFQNAPIHSDRTFGNQVPTSVAGDSIVFRAMLDSIVAGSACPQDLNPCNGFSPTPVGLKVWRPREATRCS
ncbi:MAG: urea carboxylase-associated family protein [Acidimicrobiales bacterium]